MTVEPYSFALTAVKIGCTAASVFFGYRFRNEIKRSIKDLFLSADDLESTETTITNEIDSMIGQVIGRV